VRPPRTAVERFEAPGGRQEKTTAMPDSEPFGTDTPEPPATSESSTAQDTEDSAARGAPPPRRPRRRAASRPAGPPQGTDRGEPPSPVATTDAPADTAPESGVRPGHPAARRRTRKIVETPVEDPPILDSDADTTPIAEPDVETVVSDSADWPESLGPDEPAVTPRHALIAPTFLAPEAMFQAPEVPERATAALVGGDDIVLDEVSERPAEEEISAEDEAGGVRRRRRRRGGRGRRRRGDEDGAEESAEDFDAEQVPAESVDEDEEADVEEEIESAVRSDDDQAGPRRRRRRRRRKGEDTELAPDDPADTVVRVREPRAAPNGDEIALLKGSTRIEAKRQRRREGREAGRRRPPIATEAEFLARRESVNRVMVIRQRGDLTQIAVLEDGVLVEHYVSQRAQQSMIGNIYLGRVQNVLPAMEAAFVDVGRGRNAVLYAGEVDWDGVGLTGEPRRIETALKSGQTVLVQVTKDPVAHKGARLTSQVSLPGRYLVYVPGGSMSGISRKLPDTERARLKKILKDVVPEDAAVIVRTAAEGASDEELTSDVARLESQWNEISAKAESGSAPALLYGEPDLTVKVVRDLFNEDVSQLVVSGDDAWQTVQPYVSTVAPNLADRLEKWVGDVDVFAAYRVDEQIAKALDRKVWLPSGGSVVFDRTEAMTVVDVNTGKFTGSGGNLEETVTKNNLEAAEEIVRQLRLRDIGGIIVIDFIDMVLESNRELVLRRLVECLGRDRTKHQVAEVTSLGLVQMTRKRIGTGLLEAFSEPCDCCNGRGLIVHLEPVTPGSGNGQGNGRRDGRRGRFAGPPAPPLAETNGPPPAETQGPSPAEIAASVHAASSDGLSG
jgi:ribonuclease E